MPAHKGKNVLGVEDKDITEPAVPEKKGYTGVWAEYELAMGDVTVEAVYTKTASLLWLWMLIAILVAGGFAVVAIVLVNQKKTASGRA